MANHVCAENHCQINGLAFAQSDSILQFQLKITNIVMLSVAVALKVSLLLLFFQPLRFKKLPTIVFI